MRFRPLLPCLAVLLLAAPAWAGPDVADKFSIGSGAGTDHKPQSKLWFHDGSWWTVMYDGSSQRIWKFENGAFVRQTYPDAAVDSRASARADVLWDGTALYVMIWHEALPRFTKYTYDSNTQVWQRLAGFPLDLPIAGTEVLVIDKDSTGRVWATYELNRQIHAIWTTTPDHLSWNTTGVVLHDFVDSDDISTIIAFGGDKIGAFWSDQGAEAAWEFGFRVHRDADPPEVWQPLEIVDMGSAVDDHINAAADADGRVYVAAKDLYNRANLYVRGTGGGWTRAATDINAGNCTRPIVQIDEASDLVRVFYTDWITSPNPILMATAPRSTLVFGTPEVWLSPAGLSLNDVTGTKQRLTARTGIMAMASSSSSAYWGFANLDFDAPVITILDPADEKPGVPLQPLVQVRLQDAGMGVRRSSVVLALDGVPVTPTFAGSAAEYLLSWTPAAPLQPGHIYQLDVAVEDLAWPPHSDAAHVRFRTEMEPIALDARIDFQPASATPAPGYSIDSGKKYTLDTGTGWSTSMTPKKAGVHPDLRLDTWIERKNSSTRVTWWLDVANGVYRLSFAAGSPTASGKQKVEVEGEVLLNSQATSAGQFLSVSDYPVTVQDGQLTVKIGGAGGSTYTQLCYIDVRYEGPAPPPTDPPPGGDAAPRPVSGLVVARAGSDLQLSWNSVSEDTTGAVIAVTRYHVYRGSTPTFVPNRSTHSNRVGLVSGTTFTDVGALNAATDVYYRVTAERVSGTESSCSSNLGVRRSVALAAPSGPTRTAWLALPYTNAHANAQGLVASMNGGTGAGPVVAVSRVDRSTQVEQTWAWSGAWSGQNFALIPGEAVEVTVAAAWSWVAVGSEAGSPAYGFAFRTDVGNLSWIALPPNAAYTDARSLASALNGGSGAGPVTRLAWLDPQTARTESWVWLAGAWCGTNFALAPGTGVAVLVRQDLPSWTPALGAP